MRLTKVTITNYRCINDSGPVEIGDVTGLVGKNESGKTAFLQALRRLIPVEDSSTYDDVMDYPANSFARYKKVRAEQPAEVVTATFELNDDEVALIEEDLGTSVLRERAFTVTKRYPNGATTYDVKVDEAAAVRHLLTGVVLPEGQVDLIRRTQSIDGLTETLDAIQEPDLTVTELRQQIAVWQEEDLTRKLIDAYLQPRCRGSSTSTTTAPSRASCRSRSCATGATPTSSRTPTGPCSRWYRWPAPGWRTSRTPAATSGSSASWRRPPTASPTRCSSSGRRTSSSRSSWRSPTPRPARSRRSTKARSCTSGSTTRGTASPSRSTSAPAASSGFFSFLAHFSELEQDNDERDIILLLDEPGLNLHATAQRDLLRFIDERLAPRHQVIYTTHSPFMIKADRLDRIRTVQDIEEEGTKVSAEVFRTDNETVFPLQAALGYDLAQTLFVGPHNLLVEGPSDLLYIQLLNQALAAKAMATLDPRWVVVPVGGADKVATFVSLLGGNQLNVAVLMDISSNSMQRIRNLQANAKLPANALVLISEVTNANEADIEDLFDPGFYLELVNGTYQAELPNPLTLADLPKGNPRIVRRLEQHFADNDIASGEFNHYLPAAYFLQEQATLLPRVDLATLDRAERLFRRVNELLRA